MVSQRVFKDTPIFHHSHTFHHFLTFHDIDEDISHSLVHFLYTRDYKTIHSALNRDTSDIAREYQRSILIYLASRKYNLTNLKALAQ